MNECKHCEYCDLTSNTCLLNFGVCYESGWCLHDGCEFYSDGTWTSMTVYDVSDSEEG